MKRKFTNIILRNRGSGKTCGHSYPVSCWGDDKAENKAVLTSWAAIGWNQGEVGGPGVTHDVLPMNGVCKAEEFVLANIHPSIQYLCAEEQENKVLVRLQTADEIYCEMCVGERAQNLNAKQNFSLQSHLITWKWEDKQLTVFVTGTLYSHAEEIWWILTNSSSVIMYGIVLYFVSKITSNT